MTRLYRSLAGFILCAALAACNSPRGAGFQSEVLAAENTTTDANGDPIYDFAVFPVTRESLPIIQSWPANNLRQYRWIAHQDQPQSLLISPDDILQVAIWDTEENSLLTGAGERVAELKDMKVGSDGRIFLPFVGSLKVSGMSPQTAREHIQATLENVMPSAQVQLNVDPGRGNTANLVSGVKNPGIFPLTDRNISLLTLMSSGGGVSPNLVNPQVRLFRGSQVYGLSLSRLFEEPELDTVVQGGDRILIEEDERYFLSLGATTREALHAFPKDEVSALDALSIVGGVSAARANPQGILILREYPASAVRAAGPTPDGPPQERVVFTIDLTKADGLFSAAKFKIQSGDLVYGTESPLGTANSIVGIVGNLLLARARI